MSKVLCPGEILIDFFRSDEGDFEYNGEMYEKKAGGASANVAIAIQKLGAKGIFLGSVGNDEYGVFLVETLMKYGATTMGVKVVDEKTTLAIVTLSEDGEREFKFRKGAASTYRFDMISEELLDDVSVIHFGSAMAFMGGELEDTYYKLLEFAHARDIIVTFDPNYRDVLFGNRKEVFIQKSKDFIAYSHVVKVSDEEAMIISGKDTIEDAAKELLKIGAQNVLVTLGKDGTLFATNNTLERIPVIPVKMKDATGAGDAFIGAVIAQLAQSKDLSIDAMKRYIQFGNKVGSITVQSVGALDSIPSLNDL